MKADRRLFLQTAGLATAAILSGCSAPTVKQHGAPGIDVSGPNSLRSHVGTAGLLFGFAVDARSLNEPDYARLVREQCSILVPENAMKWAALEPEQGRFTFNDADDIVAFAERYRIKVRGHNLVWHESLPPWLNSMMSPQTARDLMTNHIRIVASRYAGCMHSWDVVNEAINIADGRPDGLRITPWLRNAGDDYLELAYRTAREADATALLTYNEFGLDTETLEAERKRTATLLMLQRMKRRNVPIDAVGIQAHLTAGGLYGYGAGLSRFIAGCRALDLQIFITEIDVDDRALPKNIDARDRGVAKTYSSYLDVALRDPAVHAVLIWGVTDRSSWLNKDSNHHRTDGESQRPLLFDDEGRPKPAFAAVRDCFDSRAGTAKGLSRIADYRSK